jgi:hypothetical protein
LVVGVAIVYAFGWHYFLFLAPVWAALIRPVTIHVSIQAQSAGAVNAFN